MKNLDLDLLTNYIMAHEDLVAAVLVDGYNYDKKDDLPEDKDELTQLVSEKVAENWFQTLIFIEATDLFLASDKTEIAEELGIDFEKIWIMREITAGSAPEPTVGHIHARIDTLVKWMVDNYDQDDKKSLAYQLVKRLSRYTSKKSVFTDMKEFFSLTSNPIARLDVEIQTGSKALIEQLQTIPGLEEVKRDDLAEALFTLSAGGMENLDLDLLTEHIMSHPTLVAAVLSDDEDEDDVPEDENEQRDLVREKVGVNWFYTIKQIEMDNEFLSEDNEEIAKVLGIKTGQIWIMREMTAKSAPRPADKHIRARTDALIKWMADNYDKDDKKSIAYRLVKRLSKYTRSSQKRANRQSTTTLIDMTEFFSLTRYPIARLDVEIQTGSKALIEQLQTIPGLEDVKKNDLAEALFMISDMDSNNELIDLLATRSSEFKAQELILFAQLIGCNKRAKCKTRADAAKSINDTCSRGRLCVLLLNKALRALPAESITYFEGILSTSETQISGINGISKELRKRAVVT
jgi:hypothetical protein